MSVENKPDSVANDSIDQVGLNWINEFVTPLLELAE